MPRTWADFRNCFRRHESRPLVLIPKSPRLFQLGQLFSIPNDCYHPDLDHCFQSQVAAAHLPIRSSRIHSIHSVHSIHSIHSAVIGRNAAWTYVSRGSMKKGHPMFLASTGPVDRGLPPGHRSEGPSEGVQHPSAARVKRKNLSGFYAHRALPFARGPRALEQGGPFDPTPKGDYATRISYG